MRRVRTPEIMDDPSVPREDLALSLRYIRAVNRRLSGVAALLDHLRTLARDPHFAWPADRPLTLLDIATGSADLPIAALRWARSAGLPLRITGVDLHPTTLELAREHIAEQDRAHPPAVGEPSLAGSIELRQADALRLMDEFKPGSFDVVHAGLFLHHLSELEILTVLRIMDRLATRAVVWNDLVRSRVGYGAIHLLTLGMPRIVRHDATVSVRAGFTKREALDLARRAGWTDPRHRWSLFTHRFTILSTKPPPTPILSESADASPTTPQG